MVCRSSLVALLLAAGCFVEPSSESSATSDGTSSDGATTKGIENTETTPPTTSVGPDGSSSTGSSTGTTGECPAGDLGCPCDAGDCYDDATCVDGFCEIEIPVGCGDSETIEPERCDDGNNDPGDGCSPSCTLERECFLAHLGGPKGDALVRAYSLSPDGTMLVFDDIEVPAHNPPPFGPGSELSGAAVSCRGLVYVASSTAGVITGLQTSRDELSQVDDVTATGVRELACDPDLGLLFATRFIDNGFALDTFDVSAGTLVLAASDQYTDSPLPEMRAARLSLDRGSGRALVSFVGESASPSAVAVSLIEATYGANSLSLGTATALGVVRDDLSALLHVAPTSELLGIGAGASGGPVIYVLPLTKAGMGNIDVLTGSPWQERRNIWPLRLPGGEVGFAMGGSQGVVLAGYTKGAAIETLGETLSPELSNTFARTAFDGSILIVASPDGFETYDLTQPPEMGPPEMLNQMAGPTTETFASGAVVPCP